MILVVFDMDGTLLDTQDLITEHMAATFRSMGLTEPTPAQSRRVIGLSLPVAMARLAATDDSVLIHGLVEAYRAHYRASVLTDQGREALFPGALEALQRLNEVCPHTTEETMPRRTALVAACGELKTLAAGGLALEAALDDALKGGHPRSNSRASPVRTGRLLRRRGKPSRARRTAAAREGRGMPPVVSSKLRSRPARTVPVRSSCGGSTASSAAAGGVRPRRGAERKTHDFGRQGDADARPRVPWSALAWPRPLRAADVAAAPSNSRMDAAPATSIRASTVFLDGRRRPPRTRTRTRHRRPPGTPGGLGEPRCRCQSRQA